MNAVSRRPTPMLRITLQYIWRLSEQLEPLGRLAEGDVEVDLIDLMLALYEPQAAVEALLTNSVFAHTLRSSRPLALHLHQEIKKQIERETPSGKVHAVALWTLKNAYQDFKVAFLAELGTFPSYFVTQKGSHDTLTLLDAPELMFPRDLAVKVPEAMFDVAEAGKALCYELPTACGFHLFRAAEAVLRRYYHHVTGGKAPPKIRNIMVYVHAIRTNKCGDETILSVIEQLSKLHRNPLIHPEAVLTLDEALSIHGMARSAVTAMLNVLPVLPQTTAVVPASAA